jgi:hypothetical protein
MSVTERQFQHLSAMGIDLWQQKAPACADSSTTDYAQISLAELSNNRLFQDLLASIQLSPSELSCNGQQLNLGLFNWQFSPTAAQQQTQNEPIMHFDQQHSTLTTPLLERIAQSSALKKQLWRHLHHIVES